MVAALVLVGAGARAGALAGEEAIGVGGGYASG